MLVLVDSKKDSVHRLRTSTRRIEAQLELLSLLPDLPDYRKAAKKVRRPLKELRRAAGLVRDLDVQRGLVKGRVTFDSAKKLRKDAYDLRRVLKHQRSAEIETLEETVKKEQDTLAPALERLMEALKPAEGLAISFQQVGDLTLNWYRQDTSSAEAGLDSDGLHAIRRSAKLARYMAETAATEVSRSFEAIQEAGGKWHDLLTLGETARRHLGGKSMLTQAISRECENALEEYREVLRRQDSTTG